jgi:hypothetical protein
VRGGAGEEGPATQNRGKLGGGEAKGAPAMTEPELEEMSEETTRQRVEVEIGEAEG